ncbi:Ig-like domain-containing protein [Salegentibacter sp. F188]|uniref:Ig-like domain-containing protein n=1 Tax=Autumnicola patrickiae TaxID=3075591 RepID=A0ABU3E457_9FLAO|nr:Ig-like domain-containing protein [Salegentibacter sp. F188]MDT0690769.1 Ig-like domain-containing protein [Salegentibacter sp. F188]
MRNRIPGYLIVIILLLTLVQCAKKGMPEGGPKDEEPPEFIRANPENYTTNFNKKEIRIFFDEYVKLKNPQQQIIISPPMDPRPSILPLGSARRDVQIEIFDTLEENTTYAINFGKSIIDNNESNPLNYFKYVFSTGDYIDSLEVGGTVEDAYLKNPEDFISVFLYEVDSTYSDSVVYQKTPRYVTYTLDSTNIFQLENLKAGTYQMVAITDNNDNYLFNPKSEKIGFIDNYVTIPTDSTYEMTLFKEELEFEIQRPKQLKGQQILFGYEGVTALDSVRIELLNPKPDNFTSRIVKDRKTDSLYYWYEPQLETDSLYFEVISPRSRDTLIARISEMARDSLTVSATPSGNIAFDQEVILRANTPLVESNDSLISVVNQDSIFIPFSTELSLIENELRISFEKEESSQYSIRALPGTVVDMFEATNDTLTQRVTTKAFSEFGNITFRLQNVEQYPIIVQITDLKGVPIAEKYSTGESVISFSNVNPGNYFMRIIYDRNENSKWDTGNYLKKLKPEKIEYFPDTLTIRANWDMDELFILE